MVNAKPKTGKSRNNLIFFIFLLPVLFAFCMVIVIPFFMGIYYSFTDWNAITGTKITWVGLKNYMALAGDVTFLNALLVTTAFAILNIIAVNVVSFGLALLVTGKLRFTNFYRSAFFLPNLIGGIVLGYIWQFIFNSAVPTFGKLSGFTWLYEHLFLTNRYLALIAIVVVSTWQYAGYIMMIYIAGIQGISDSLTEAAEIDGANYGQRLRYITLPLVAPAFTVSLFLTLVNSFKQFDVNYSLSAGGPSGMFLGKAIQTNEFLALNIYNTAFAFKKLAQGQAKAVLFFVVLTVISLIQVYYNKRKELEM